MNDYISHLEIMQQLDVACETRKLIAKDSCHKTWYKKEKGYMQLCEPSNMIFKCYNLIMMLLHARDNNIQSFAYIWLHKRNQNEFLKHPKIKKQVVKQWTGNPEVGGFSPPSNHLIFECVRNSF